ncbi:MAG: glycosyltransferase family 39 protein [Candidatus Hydrogenedentes bacterium]|nr:glycosyltransferase family 39 protein [Candidatus Hydrogenedentota bacterium]
MSPEISTENASLSIEDGLLGVYVRTALWYLLVVAICWALGIEASYGSPLPFYALLRPAVSTWVVPGLVVFLAALLLFAAAPRWQYISGGKHSRSAIVLVGICGLLLAIVAFRFDLAARSGTILSLFLGYWKALRWHLLVLAVAAGFTVLFARVLLTFHNVDTTPTGRSVAWSLAGLILFSFMFSGAVAMLRDGPHGISQAYERQTYEFIGDIGRGRTIKGLLHDYVRIHPYLSMHAKVHPPGPIVLLWLMSYVAGREPLGLSLATMLLGSTGVIPLYFWARDMTSKRTALIGCLLYSLMPSIVLFTATSADILFLPFVATTLFLFWRAMDRSSIAYAAAAGISYGILSLLSFSLIGIGAFFGLVGLWRLAQKEYRASVFQIAAVMLLAFLAVHLAVRFWSGFDVIACFRACKSQFESDQIHLEAKDPRFPAWTWKFLNPMCWFYFAGIPVSVLFLWRLWRPEPNSRALFVILGLTLIALDLLDLARGEGERSAMYILPFVVLPAAHALQEIMARTRSCRPLIVTLGFLVVQCWITESVLYTFW